GYDYIMYGRNNNCKNLTLGKIDWKDENTFILSKGANIRITTPMYGESYNLSSVKYPNTFLYLDNNSDNISSSGKQGTQLWTILPEDAVPIGFTPMCYFLSNYKV